MFAVCLAYTHSALALELSDQSDIEQIILGYTNAWNNNAGKGFGDGFAEDADFVNIFGMHFTGRAEIEERHVKILQTFLKGSVLKIVNIQLREIQPGIVVAIIPWSVDGFRNPKDLSQPAQTREGIFTQVFFRTNNKWEIVASQNTLKAN